jgi:EAL domain-containing protein (putative c-di-GMP-specific phosphodiesterase class I)
VDDFGTGYSSLAYLKRFPLDTLKIDRSFIAELHDGAQDAAIVRAIIAMAHSLELNVVAEGVEEDSQLELLREWGCDDVQGYLISRPVNADDFTELLVRAQPTLNLL